MLPSLPPWSRESRRLTPTGRPMSNGAQITELLVLARDGQPEAWDRLLPLVYEELHRLARYHLRHERDGHTLNATALVHEAYLKLVDPARLPAGDRRYFFAISSRAMRQVLVDHARRQRAAKRGAGVRMVPLGDVDAAVEEEAESLLALDEALSRLAELDVRLARVVECRYFAGLTEEETAEALGVTARTVRRDWTKARLWLYDQLRGAPA
jgi:RNA polymerase sigma factor (TIGR02999 family)